MSEHELSRAVVELRGVWRRFGAKIALQEVSLAIQAGTVLGLVGENGAGKTTLIRHVLGLLKAERGSVRVFGRDPAADPVGVLSRVGYLSEEADLPGWMRVEELLRYCGSFYPGWDPRYAGRLREEFGLSPQTPIRDLSKGQRARLGLVAALAHRPELLLLDEPSSGLDPVVRQDILTAIIRTIADEGRTVLFSSHLLTEVERVADRVAMMRKGRILFCDDVSEIKEGHRRVTLRFGSPRATPPALEGVLAWQGAGREWTALCSGRPEQLEAAAALLDAQIVQQRALSLDEIFLARVSAGAEER
jgi:ABC-2 type transport system ATP-binding protein